MSSVNDRRKVKAFEKALRKRFGNTIPAFFKFKVHSSFQDTYDSIVLPTGSNITLPTKQELETEYNSEITKEESRPFQTIDGDLQVGTSNLYVDTSTSRVGIGKSDPAYTLDVNGSVYASGDVIMFSDQRKKTNIEPITNALDKVLQLRGVTFDKIDDDTRRHAGIIAQEVEKVLPEVVYTDDDGMKSVAYGNLIALLIEAIKELTKS